MGRTSYTRAERQPRALLCSAPPFCTCVSSGENELEEEEPRPAKPCCGLPLPSVSPPWGMGGTFARTSLSGLAKWGGEERFGGARDDSGDLRLKGACHRASAFPVLNEREGERQSEGLGPACFSFLFQRGIASTPQRGPASPHGDQDGAEVDSSSPGPSLPVQN